MRSMLRVLSVNALMACASAPPPTPGPAPVTVPETPSPAPAPVSPVLAFSYRPARLAVRMTTEAMSAVVDGAAADSQAIRSTLLTSIYVEGLGDSLRITGRLDSLTVEPSRLAAAGSGFTRLNLPLAFGGMLGSQGRFTLRVGADSAGGCWSEARAALDPLAGMFPHVPATLRSGERWQDSMETSSCRLGIPVRARERRVLVLDRVADGVAHVSYTTTTTASGTRTVQASAVSYAGQGEARGAMTLDLTAGVVRTDERDGIYRVTVTVDGRARELTQRSRWKAEATSLP